MTFKSRVQEFLRKAIGFPPWTGSTTDIIPGGWGVYDGNSQHSMAGSIAAVYGSWRVLCQTIGSVPWNVYKEDKQGVRIKAFDHPLYAVLHDSPNSFMTSMEFRESMILGFCSTGNAYAEKVMLGNRVVSLNPLRSDFMTPVMEKGGLVQPANGLIYRYRRPDGTTRDYTSDEIIHLKNFSLDGIRGLSPLSVHAIRHASATESYATNFMLNQGRPSGVLESKKPRPKDPDYNNKLSADWQRLYGSGNIGGTAVLWDEMTYKAVSISPNEAQYIETKKLNAGDICAIYGVPLNMLGQSDKTATYASAEQFQIDFIRHTIRPLAVRLEQVINKALFATQPGVFCVLDLDGLLRGDSKTQAEYLQGLVGAGLMTRNEGRHFLNLPERPEADLLTVRAYEIDLNALPKLSAEATPGVAQSDIRNGGKSASLDFIETAIKEYIEKSAQEVKLLTTTASQETIGKIEKQKTETDARLRAVEKDVQKIEQTPAPKPMKKRGKAKRNPDGTMSFEIEEFS